MPEPRFADPRYAGTAYAGGQEVVWPMSLYEIMPRRRQSGYKVEVITDGIHHTILGFKSKAEAADWAEADKERQRAFPITDGD